MPKFKRGMNGTGTVRKLSGNRRKPFQAVAPAFEDADGRLVRKTIGCFETRQEALDAVYAYRLAPQNEADLTLEALYKQWSEKGYNNIAPSTINAYKAAWSKFAPIYDKKVAEIKTPQWQFCFDRVAETGASSSTLNNMRVVAYKLSRLAMQQDIISKNYAEFVQLPRTDKKEKAIFTEAQLKKIEQGAKDDIGVSVHIFIMCYTGWRIQEYCNLTKADYDAEAHTLCGGTKTEAGRNRIVPLPEKAEKYVAEIFAHSDKLFSHSQNILRDAFYITLDTLGIQDKDERRYTPHTTRHTYNSMLIKADVPVEIRMRLMGQCDINTNIKTYSHAELNTLQNAVNRIAQPLDNSLTTV